MTTTTSLEGRVALVSGVARGQGRSHARFLAARGAKVIGFDLCGPINESLIEPATTADLDETRRLVEEAGGEIVVEVADARSYDSVEKVMRLGVERFGPVDVVVANAGILGKPGDSWAVSESMFRDVLDVNLLGAWNTLRAGIAPMVDAGTKGSAVVTGSGASVKGLANIMPYVASKHAVVGMVQSMARELAPRGIRVNAVLPGNADTTMFHNDVVHAMYLPDLAEHDEEEFLRRARQGIPMGVPFVRVEDISDAICFLVSDAARMVTGALFPVDGGSAIP